MDDFLAVHVGKTFEQLPCVAFNVGHCESDGWRFQQTGQVMVMVRENHVKRVDASLGFMRICSVFETYGHVVEADNVGMIKGLEQLDLPDCRDRKLHRKSK